MTGGLAASHHRVPGWPEGDHETVLILVVRRRRVNFGQLNAISDDYGVLPAAARSRQDNPPKAAPDMPPATFTPRPPRRFAFRHDISRADRISPERLSNAVLDVTN